MVNGITDTAEYQRLQADKHKEKYWRRWGPYLAEREWGTVREDYSVQGNTWDYFTHHQSRYRAYRWSEDGLGGISDNHQLINFGLGLWNGNDTILKERMFGVSTEQGNHGEDVKEYYYYLDSTPTHSYMKFLYRYPHKEYPYKHLVDENERRNSNQSEYELTDTGIFDDKKYFDIMVEYAKQDDQDICIRITVTNKADIPAELTLLGQIWFRNTWAWEKDQPIPEITSGTGDVLNLEQEKLGQRYLYCAQADEYIFTNNETNTQVLYNDANRSKFTKEAFHRYIINDFDEVINPEETGTKAAAVYRMELAGGESKTFHLRLTDTILENPFDQIDTIFASRIAEADEFYDHILSGSAEQQQIQRQALAGMLWNKQFYHYIVREWLQGDPDQIQPPTERLTGRNSDWVHFHAKDILSVPDTWEYPWLSTWDSAFQMIPFMMVDPEFAKNQLILVTREWYMHPSGDLPAYELDFNAIHPPVQAYSAWKIYKLETEIYGTRDVTFLERIFQKLLLNFTWFVNREDSVGKNIFQGGFLGMDNIGIFDRSHPLPTSGHLEQADGTAWMGMYALNMMRIALELAQHNPAYEDIASKFFEHFIRIAHSIKSMGPDSTEGLWDADDEFFYDLLHFDTGGQIPLRVRSMVGLIPLFAVEVIEPDILEKVPEFNQRMHWFIENRPELAGNVICETDEDDHRHLFSIVREDKLVSILTRVLDEREFLSKFGIRSLSKYHLDYPFTMRIKGKDYTITYEPAESNSADFGGNSNWRGPIWFPINYLLIESLDEFFTYYDDTIKVEYPTGSDERYTLDGIATKLRQRITSIFDKNDDGRPVYDRNEFLNSDDWVDHLLFYEYFHGDTGAGLGASHQTGWTGLIAELIHRQHHDYRSDPSPID